MTSVVGRFEWRGERLTLRRAQGDDVPGIVAFYRHETDAPAADSAVAWFSLGGPWMHEHFCARHVRVYEDLGWDCWVVERGDGTIAGSVEICYAVEPPPFGRYAHLELLELAEDLLLVGEVEDWILDRCESRARERGYDRFWCRPVGSGGSPEVLARRGYVERWRNGWVTLRNLDRVEAPPYQERSLLGDYDGEASHLLALNHRESASYRWRYLWRPVLTPDASDFPTDVSFSGRGVALRGRPPANVLVNVWRWRDPRSAWVDLWVEPDLATDAGYVSDLVAVGCRRASAMGASSAEVVVPESIVGEIERRFDAERVSLEMGDPWLMKELR